MTTVMRERETDTDTHTHTHTHTQKRCIEYIWYEKIRIFSVKKIKKKPDQKKRATCIM